MAHATSELVGEFLDALDHGTTPPCNANDNRRSLALMLAAYQSNESGCPIPLRYE
jgi:predicted dehydrogenase